MFFRFFGKIKQAAALMIVLSMIISVPLNSICLADMTEESEPASEQVEPEVENLDENTDENTGENAGESAEELTGVEGFVSRLYLVALGREPDQNGFDSWIRLLKNGDSTGAEVARGFILSPEFLSRNYSPEEYLTFFYRIFFDREPDTQGFNDWLARIREGLSYSETIDGFVNSVEWANVCISFGILSGGNARPSIVPEVNGGVQTFVTSLYNDCLGRNPDSEGLEGWCQRLSSMIISGKEAAYGFFYSPEFQNKMKSLSDEELIAIFYRVFLNREADESGLYGWLRVLEYGGGLGDLFHGFSDSHEFRLKCVSYGIYAGESIPVTCTAMDSELIDSIEWQYGSGMQIMNNMSSGLNPHREYVTINVQGSTARTSSKTISDRDWAVLENFAREHFLPTWTPAMKAAYTLYWINRNVTYASTSSLWNSISGQGYAEAIFVTRVGQCAQYNGALCEMLCYLGYDARMIQGYRSSRSGSYFQHFWCEINVDGTYYCMETGNYAQSGNWSFFCDLYYPEGSATRYVKNS